jgi:hypothetical protein
VVEPLSGMCKVLGMMPSTTKNKTKQNKHLNSVIYLSYKMKFFLSINSVKMNSDEHKRLNWGLGWYLQFYVGLRIQFLSVLDFGSTEPRDLTHR